MVGPAAKREKHRRHSINRRRIRIDDLAGYTYAEEEWIRIPELTLSVDEEVIEQAKRLAAERHTSAAVWSLAERAAITAHSSAVSYPAACHIIGKLRGARWAVKALDPMRSIFQTVPLDEHILRQATDANLADVDDAIQLFSAARAGATHLITRHPDRFPGGSLAMTSPREFLAACGHP